MAWYDYVTLRLASVHLPGHPALDVIFKCLPKKECMQSHMKKYLMESNGLKLSGVFLPFLHSKRVFSLTAWLSFDLRKSLQLKDSRVSEPQQAQVNICWENIKCVSTD